MSSQVRKVPNPHFSILALISFIASFAVARIFTTLSPSVVILVGNGIHIHHFWYGLALLAVGGWLGIINQTQRVDQLAAVLYGAGAGLIADEFGLLLTFGDYWNTMTYTIVGILLAFAFLGLLLIRHRGAIRAQFGRLTRIDAVFYCGIFLAMVSVAFLTTTGNSTIFIVTGVLTIVALVMIVFSAVYRLNSRNKKKIESVGGKGE
jgi:hypothetical protein